MQRARYRYRARKRVGSSPWTTNPVEVKVKRFNPWGDGIDRMLRRL
jgi:hypothetical protein